MTRRFKPWGYQLDYDKAIAEDERVLAMLARHAELELYAPDDAGAATWRWIDLLLLRDPERRLATALELTETDLSALAAYFEVDPKFGLNLPAVPEDWYRRADAIAQRLDWAGDSLPTRARAEALAKHAKATLARHKRNRAKWGAQ